MRVITTFVLLCWSLSLQAAIVTFEDVTATSPCGYGAPVPCLNSIVTPQGFVFEDTTGPGLGEIYVQSGGPTGNFITTAAFPEDAPNIRVTHQSGQAFDLHSLDVDRFAQSLGGPATAPGIRGYDESNNLIASLEVATSVDGGWTTVSFDGNWNAVHSVVVTTMYFCNGFGCANRFPEMDNFNATVVPIPAAVWLFISGLGSLFLVRPRRVH